MRVDMGGRGFAETLERNGLRCEKTLPHGNLNIYCRECAVTWKAGPTISGQVLQDLIDHARRHRAS